MRRAKGALRLRPRRVAVVAAAGALALGLPGTGRAFDTAPHFDITGDALTAEGFGRDATRLAQVNNWFNDLYVNAKDVPQSGHASWWKTLLGARWYLGEIEDWSFQVVAAGSATHFDSNNGGLGYRRVGDLDAELYRLLDMTVRVCRQGKPDPLVCLTAIGASLHEVQDFYAHTNWVEPKYGELPGYDGPGWASRGLGDTPTWFDLPSATRNPAASRTYTNGTPDDKVDYSDKLFNRGHGSWKSDANKQLGTKMNKDWPGRPRYAEAFIASYFATRQWTQVVRRELNDEAFWNTVRSYAPATAKARGDLTHDIRKGARGVSYWTGHWQGQGEPTGAADPGPGGSLDDVFLATREYFSRDRTIYRTLYETVVTQLRQTPAPLQRYEMPSTRSMQEATQFVRVQVLKTKGRGAGDIGPDEADFYAEGLVAGQHFLSGFIHGEDSFSFRRPNYPFTFIKAVAVADRRPQSLTGLRVRVRTSATTDGAGTDDNVYLRLSDTLRFKLDKIAVDDFESASTATYSLPVDTTTPFDRRPEGYFLSDIRYVQLEKSKDGRSGAWKLGGVTLFANGGVLYRNDGIERWLRGNARTWRAPNFTPGDGLAETVPVWLSLYDADSFLYGGDDHADLDPDYRRRNIGVIYRLGTVVERTTVGGSRYAGPISSDGDKAEIRYRIDTLKTTAPPLPPPPPPPPGPPPPPPPPAGKPDLVISALDTNTFTVRNQGNAAAGPFSVQVVGYNTIAFAGLAAGAQEKRTYTSGCSFGIHEARADYLNQVAESNETNNVRTIDVIC